MHESQEVLEPRSPCPAWEQLPWTPRASALTAAQLPELAWDCIMIQEVCPFCQSLIHRGPWTVPIVPPALSSEAQAPGAFPLTSNATHQPDVLIPVSAWSLRGHLALPCTWQPEAQGQRSTGVTAAATFGGCSVTLRQVWVHNQELLLCCVVSVQTGKVKKEVSEKRSHGGQEIGAALVLPDQV